MDDYQATWSRPPGLTQPCNGSVRLVEPEFAGRLNGLTLLSEVFIADVTQHLPHGSEQNRKSKRVDGGMRQVCRRAVRGVKRHHDGARFSGYLFEQMMQQVMTSSRAAAKGRL
jgi:hypothetical protein